MIVLLDNGHGSNTLGKCSPDGKLREYKWTRDCVKLAIEIFKKRGIDVRQLVPEDYDVSLRERCNRANAICKTHGSKNVVLVSVHNDAAPDTPQTLVEKGKYCNWHSPHGFSARVSYNASSNSKRLAKIFTELAIERKLTGNRSIPVEKYWVQNLAMCRDTNCPAVLIECMFQDNKEDYAFLMSEKGKTTFANLIVDAIMKYIG